MNSATHQKYYSDQWQVLEERVDGDTVTQYVWSAVYVDAMILRDRDADANTGNGLEERIYVLHDANYNVTALVDTSGNVLERYYYEAYGRAVYLDDAFALLPDGQSEHAWQHLHQGGRLDTITDNYHFRNRDLSYPLGRWISQDPIGFDAGDANLYRYVGNGPGNYLDSDGLIRFPGGLPLISVSPWSLGTASWDDVQRGLDLLGFVPVLGAGPDLVNAGIDFLRGNTESGAINLVAAIPLWGDGVKAAKIVKGIKSAGRFDETVETVDEAISVVQTAYPNAVQLPQAISGLPYAGPPAGVKNWFQIHPAEPGYNELPHIKYVDWTSGKKESGGSWGHIYFEE
jgi:RHS repeat-associated protein